MTYTSDELTNKLMVGDTLAVLKKVPSGVLDLAITSPPYNKQEKNKGWLVNKVVYSEFKDKLPEDEYQANQVAVLNEIYRITKTGGSFFYNHKIRWVDGDMLHPMDWLRRTDWVIKQEIIWDRIIAANIRGWRFWQVEERIYWLYKPIADNKKGAELASKDAKLTSIWRGPPEGKNPHPAPFPLWLPARIIMSLLNGEKRGLVFDPYMGSGTVAVAAKLLGHDYFGIDISRDYIAYAQNRLSHAENEMAQVAKESALHTVTNTFKARKLTGMNTGKHRVVKTTPMPDASGDSPESFDDIWQNKTAANHGDSTTHASGAKAWARIRKLAKSG